MAAVALLGPQKAFALKNADLTCASLKELNVYNIRWAHSAVLLYAVQQLHCELRFAAQRWGAAAAALPGAPHLPSPPLGRPQALVRKPGLSAHGHPHSLRRPAACCSAPHQRHV